MLHAMPCHAMPRPRLATGIARRRSRQTQSGFPQAGYRCRLPGTYVGGSRRTRMTADVGGCRSVYNDLAQPRAVPSRRGAIRDGSADRLRAVATLGQWWPKRSVVDSAKQCGLTRSDRPQSVAVSEMRRDPLPAVVSSGTALQAGGRPFEPGTAHPHGSAPEAERLTSHEQTAGPVCCCGSVVEGARRHHGRLERA